MVVCREVGSDCPWSALHFWVKERVRCWWDDWRAVGFAVSVKLGRRGGRWVGLDYSQVRPEERRRRVDVDGGQFGVASGGVSCEVVGGLVHVHTAVCRHPQKG